VAPFDLAVVAIVIVVAEAEIWLPPGGCIGGNYPFGLCNFGESLAPHLVAVAYTTVASLLLLGRRRWPMQVLVSIAALSSVVALVWVASPGLGYFIPLLIAGYSVGRYHRGRHPWLTLIGAAVLLFATIAIHDLRVPGQSPGGSVATFDVVLLGALPMGRALQTRDLRAELAAAEAREARREQQETANRAVEEERARIARELHDVAAHGASLIVVQSVAAQSVFDSNPKRAQSALESIESEARTMLSEMRQLLGRISPRPGLAAASDRRETLDQLVARTRAAGQPVESRIELSPQLSDDLELTVYRCLQEALTNAVKHAPGAPTRVVASRADGTIQLEVENGPTTSTGISRGLPGAGGDGRGLVGMRERVTVLGGHFTAGPTADGGFQVRLSIPAADRST